MTGDPSRVTRHASHVDRKSKIKNPERGEYDRAKIQGGTKTKELRQVDNPEFRAEGAVSGGAGMYWQRLASDPASGEHRRGTFAS